MAPSVIDRFTGPNAALSNFYVHPFTWNGQTAPTAEHHFNAAKTCVPAEQRWVYEAPTASEAKRRGRTVTLREGWDQVHRYRAMLAICTAKFSVPELRDHLTDTGDTLLVEGTTGWCDTHWGSCSCPKHRAKPGGNHLGLILMDIRARLRGDTERWPRVALTGHRPEAFTTDEISWIQQALFRVASRLRAEHHTTTALSGFARGADLLWAQQARRADLDLWAYIPFPQQGNRATPKDTWTAPDTELWQRLRSQATREVVIDTHPSGAAFLRRNSLLVRDSNLLIAVHKPSIRSGGTVSTIRTARAVGLPVLRVDVDSKNITLYRGSRYDHVRHDLGVTERNGRARPTR